MNKNCLNVDDLAGKVAVVTGGGGVLCSCMAEALARAGAKVAVVSLHLESSAQVAQRINVGGGKAMALSCNVMDRQQLDAARDSVSRELGVCDILINGAGGNHPKGTTGREFLSRDDLLSPLPEAAGTTFFDLDISGVEYVFGLNFIGTLLPTQVFARDMAERGRGTIVNISSMSAALPLTKIPAYSAAKAAVDNFTRWLAVHMAKVNVRVNAIAPGFFLTRQNKSLLMREDGSLTPRGNAIVSHTPMGRFGDAEDLVGTLLWLASERASAFVTGAVVPVDGGFSAFSGI